MSKIRTSRPSSPTVAQELANVFLNRDNPAPHALEQAAMRRATIVSHLSYGFRFTFEDGSCITFNSRDRAIELSPICEQE